MTTHPYNSSFWQERDRSETLRNRLFVGLKKISAKSSREFPICCLTFQVSPALRSQVLPPSYHFSGIALQIGMESFRSKGAGEQDV
ncbi:MAG: hypothetical protein AAGF98_14400 [Cyanobacteria bacterium P01_H01_bin.153]